MEMIKFEFMVLTQSGAEMFIQRSDGVIRVWVPENMPDWDEYDSVYGNLQVVEPYYFEQEEHFEEFLKTGELG